jgi:hypothetical protein
VQRARFHDAVFEPKPHVSRQDFFHNLADGRVWERTRAKPLVHEPHFQVSSESIGRNGRAERTHGPGSGHSLCDTIT